ncbi:YkgJ family cysteine cluster protein [Tolypothrix campylonemoides VB511288]|nr:YkgJ family cysteine cluster protein [Tolypothrix campylonemoides VB511288]
MPAAPDHPCLSCGACCASYLVAFHWSEAEPAAAGGVPAALTETRDAHRLAMRGTWAQAPRCVALDAEIGTRSRCTIHARRPSVCREVHASWEDGTPSAQCDRARERHGLRPLAPADWSTRDDVLPA